MKAMTWGYAVQVGVVWVIGGSDPRHVRPVRACDTRCSRCDDRNLPCHFSTSKKQGKAQCVARHLSSKRRTALDDDREKIPVLVHVHAVVARVLCAEGAELSLEPKVGERCIIRE